MQSQVSLSKWPDTNTIRCALRGKKKVLQIISENMDVSPFLELWYNTHILPHGASLVAQTVKNLPAMQETWVQSLSWEDPLEKEWLPTTIFFPGEFHGQRSIACYSPWGCKESDTTEAT